MPLPTWADGARLYAADLNAAFAWSQDQTLPGVICPEGPHAAPGAGATVELDFGAPVAANDPLGFYQSGTGRLVVPAGMGGLYLLVASLAANGTSGDHVRWSISGGFTEGTWWAGTVKNGGTSTNPATLSAIGILAAGAAVHLSAQAFTSAASATRITAASLIRLGRGLGVPGA